MRPRVPHRGTDGGSAPEPGTMLPVPSRWPAPQGAEDRACCCPGRPVVRVIMPAAPGRPYRVDLLLCGHHYRTSRPALAAIGAAIQELPGREEAAEAALLRGTHRPRATVT